MSRSLFDAFGSAFGSSGSGASPRAVEEISRNATEVSGAQLREFCLQRPWTSLEAYTDCFEYTFFRALSIFIIICASINKVPQLIKIWRSGSVRGLSRTAAYAELIAFFNTTAYARHLKLGLSIYGETIVITTQNLMVVLAIYWYDRKIALHEKMLVIGTFLLYAALLLADKVLTIQHWHCVSLSVIFLNTLAQGG